MERTSSEVIFLSKCISEVAENIDKETLIWLSSRGSTMGSTTCRGNAARVEALPLAKDEYKEEKKPAVDGGLTGFDII